MSQKNAEEYSRNLQQASEIDVLKWFLDKYSGKVIFTTSLGSEDQVITHMLSEIDKPCRIITLDTGRLFQETYDTIQETEDKYGIMIEKFFPDREQVEKMVNSLGINLFYKSVENRKLCCQVRKTEPLLRALKGMEVWITGIRREQAITRFNAPLVEWDEKNQIYKVNPLRDWTTDRVWNYIKDNNIPYNSLHDKGFPSIGCLPCTRAVEPGEDIRAGRWWWEEPENKECGIHSRKK